MENERVGHDKEAVTILSGVQRFLGQTTLAFAGACSGVVLYKALFPAFYYLNWIGYLSLLWGLVALAYLGQLLTLRIIAQCKQTTLPSSPYTGSGFTVGILILVTVLSGFKVPLHASFLLAKPKLEKAVAAHAEDLDEIGRRYDRFGIYSIRQALRRCHKEDRIHFQFRDDGEAAIIYSESGIDDLCYNSGSKGHLSGNWYWMKED